ncbi:MAG: PIN domain-containing protein [Gemmatimonadales bacterium]|nr:PIN domain-containing protein [Gemmatimonadales bacterium]MBA3555483.1 PIN domain-containing protein [Gemmatimonadales bacterium]
MIVYLDSSVLLRIVLGEAGRLAQWNAIETGVSSALAEVECLRTLDRLRLRGALSDVELAGRRRSIVQVLEAVELVQVARQVLRRAADPFPTPLGTLDAVHLATALAWRETRHAPLIFATHDAELGLAAAASGLDVIGVN